MNDEEEHLPSRFQPGPRDLTNRELAVMLKSFPLPGNHGAPKFNGKSVTDFLDTYEKLCKSHLLTEAEKIKRLHKYCTPAIGQFVKSIVLKKGTDWALIRKTLRRDFKEHDFAQQIGTLGYLKALKDTKRERLGEVLR